MLARAKPTEMLREHFCPAKNGSYLGVPWSASVPESREVGALDPLSQAVVAAAVAMSVARREQLRMACLAGVAGGLVPDLDVLIRSSEDPLLALEYHRHFTHALLMVPAIGVLVGWLISFLPGLRALRRELMVFAVIGTATHGLLDACTSYGTQLYWPFSNTRVAWHLIAIIDPVPTLSALGCIALAYWSRSVWKARLGFLCFVVYLALCWVQRERAREYQAWLMGERGHVAVRRDVMPTLFNNIVFRSVYEADGRYFIDALRVPWWGESVFRAGETVAVAKEQELSRQLPADSPQSRDLVRFAWFTGGYLGQLGDGRITDVRYAVAPESVEPLWWIDLRPGEPARHVSFSMGGSFDAQKRAAFFEFLFEGK